MAKYGQIDQEYYNQLADWAERGEFTIDTSRTLHGEGAVKASRELLRRAAVTRG